MERAERSAPRPGIFQAALRRTDQVNVIAECKRRSPSRGVLRADYDAAAIARGYSAAGAAAVSVLTEPTFFDGSLEDLARVRQAVTIPLLRKDFVVSEYQLAEARAAAATIREEARADAQRIAAEVKEQAQADAARIVASAQAQIEAERQSAIVALKAQVGALAIDAASKVIGETVDDKKASAIVDRFLAEIEAEQAESTK